MNRRKRDEDDVLTRDDLEAQGDDDEEVSENPGMFQKASENTLKQRRIVKVRRQGGASDSSSGPASNPFANAFESSTASTSPAPSSSSFPSGVFSLGSTAGASSFGSAPPSALSSSPVKKNPFAGFTGLVGANSSSSTAKPAVSVGASDSSKPKNPFTGFTGLTALSTGTSAPSSTFTPNGFNSTKAFASPPASPSRNTTSNGVSTAVSSSSGSSYEEELKELNSSFHQWVNQQIKENPFSPWQDGLQDYLDFVADLKKSYPSVSSKTVTNGTSTSSSAARSDQADKFAAMSSAPPALPFATPAIAQKKTPASSQPASTSSTGFGFGGSAPSAESSTGFSFGSSTAGDDKKSSLFSSTSSLFSASSSSSAPPSTGAFSFGPSLASNSNSTGSSGLFSFSSSTSAPAASTTSTFTGFSLPAKPPSFGAAPATAEEEDDENIGKEDPTVIIKADSGDETALYENERVKLLYFRMEETNGEKEMEWRDKGIHSLQVLEHKESKSARVLMRDSGTGKVVLNAALYKALKVDEAGKNGLIVNLPDETGTKLVRYMFRVRPENRTTFKNALLTAAAKQKK